MTATGLGVVCAIGAHMEPAHTAATGFLSRITAENIRLQVLRVRVVAFVQRNSGFVVVFSNVHGAA
ncbi:hypothetical protein D3C72_2125740 [compost metagenome]